MSKDNLKEMCNLDLRLTQKPILGILDEKLIEELKSQINDLSEFEINFIMKKQICMRY